MSSPNARILLAMAGRLMKHPAAPYHEAAVCDEIRDICSENCLDFELDRFGNVLVRLRTGDALRPLVLAAHMDHPGFEVLRKTTDRSWLARFLGGVPDQYFRPGTPLRLMPGAIAAKLGRRKDKDKIFETSVASRIAAEPVFAVWELDDFSVRGWRIHGRSCDDLIGVACILTALIELKRSRAKVNVIGAISRAEEVGFHGALALAASHSLPKNALIVSLETSRELPGVTMGEGVIIRVGDRTSIFDSDGTRFLSEVANQLETANKGFQFQRALMSGGTCEATAYQEFGYQSAAVCVALGNYHNCANRNRIEAEFVNIADARGMVELLAAASCQMKSYPKFVNKLRERLKKMTREAEKKLRK